MPQWTVNPDDAGSRLDKFLAAAERVGSRARTAKALEHGKVFVNEREISLAKAGTRLTTGDIIRLQSDRPNSAKRRASLGDTRDLPIVYEDDTLMVLNKRAELLAIPLPLRRRENARSVFDDLKEYLRRRGRRRPFVVHRIDRNTSELIVFAKSASAQEELKEQFKRHLPERVYRAVVYNHPTPSTGTQRDHIVWDEKALIQKETHPRDPRNKEAISHYAVMEKLKRTALIEVKLVTERRNQIRIQARLRGHTLINEQRYTFNPNGLRPIAFARQALHAHQLAFTHPVDGRALRFETPMPEDMIELIARLRPRQA